MTRFSLIAIALAAVGCKQAADSDALTAELAVDSTNVNQAESTVLASAVDGSEAGAGVGLVGAATPQGVADWITAHAAARYSPAGCATVTESGLTVKLVFDDCTGPRGLRQLTGEMDLTVSAGSGGAIDIAAQATNLEIGQATMSVDSNAVYTASGATKSLTVTTQGSGTGPLGNTIQHDGQYTATWDASCVSLEGAWSTDVGQTQRSTTASVMRCADQCPTGTVTRDTFNGRTIDITFDGTDVAKWTSSTGRSGTFTLPCGL
ncbi:MAG TPA: hypothetical protein VL463_33705 [Kofleriaceae bacterium]|jgi:hypothetical protein|nr:hypothetical protein [Kofleriaceae bacterium]